MALDSLKDAVVRILQSKLFWAAFFPLLTKLLFLIIPTFDRELWDLLETLASAILMILGVGVGAVAGVRTYQARQAMKAHALETESTTR